MFRQKNEGRWQMADGRWATWVQLFELRSPLPIGSVSPKDWSDWITEGSFRRLPSALCLQERSDVRQKDRGCARMLPQPSSKYSTSIVACFDTCEGRVHNISLQEV